MGFATKPELALEMLTEAMAVRMPAAWAAADEAYGDNGAFRAGVAKLGLGYVLAVSCDHRIPAWPGGKRRLRADHIAATLPATCWQRVSAGTGAKGPRWYDWAWVSAHQRGHSLLIRRGSAMLALAFLMACTAAAAPAPSADPWHHARYGGPITLTAAEIRRLFNGLLTAPLRTQPAMPLRAIKDIQHWSNWRRYHQGQARRSHYQRRLATELGP